MTRTTYYHDDHLHIVLSIELTEPLPRVSPMVVMVRVSRSRVWVRLDSTMAR